MSVITVQKVKQPDKFQTASHIRTTVFVDEQGCPPELEVEHDDVAVHFLALVDDTPAGAARWRRTDHGYKLERFAVLKAFRGAGVGRALVRAVLDDLPRDHTRRYLNAQIDAVKLYAGFGFLPVGKEFVEAGIRHQQMELLPR